MAYTNVKVPEGGETITTEGGKLQVPNHPIIPFVEGDGTGRDIWRASVRVFDAAVKKAYKGQRQVRWMEVYAGEKAYKLFKSWLPDETTQAFREFRVGIKGPLTTPIGGGIRSLNVALRKLLDLYVCQRPVRYYNGTPSPVKHPEYVDMVIFRENTEDIYAGVEFQYGTPENQKFKELMQENFPQEYAKMRFPDTSGFGVKPVSCEGTERLVRAAIQWALKNKRKNLNMVHKGNIMKYTEGAFKDWGYGVAKREFRNDIVTERESWILGNKDADPNLAVEKNAAMVAPGLEHSTKEFHDQVCAEVKQTLEAISGTHGHGQWKSKILVNDRIADSVFQQVLTRADEYQVLATPNLNGDYISDACAAQIGGLGMAPGANIGDGFGVFEATHGTAPKYADKDVINPSSVILSGVMMFNFMGWREVGSLIEEGLDRTIQQKRVTYDLERQMSGATKVSTSEFASSIIENMQAPATVGR